MNLDQAAGLTSGRKRLALVPREIATHCGLRVAVVSGKGGVGKSFVSINVAVASAALGRRTLLIDGDVGLANADLLLGLVPRFDLDDWTLGQSSLSETVCPGPAGLELLLTGESRGSAEALRRALENDVADPLARHIAGYDLTLLDLGAGIGPSVVDLAARCDRVWLVATPEPTSLADAYVAVKRIWECAPEQEVELIVNRAEDNESVERTHGALNRLLKRFLGRSIGLRSQVFEDPAAQRSVARQESVVLGQPASAVARRFCLLAESLADESKAILGGGDAD